MQSNHTVSQILFLILIIHGLRFTSGQSNSLGLLSKFLRKDANSPLIVVVDTDKLTSEEDSSESDDSYSAEFKAKNDINNALIRENYQSVLYDILRTGKVSTENEEERIAEEMLIEQALRSRCQAKVQCEEKCSRSQEMKPKRERYCQKSCKAVFDYLINCPPPGNEKNRNKQSCGKKGNTCPPS